MPKRIPWGAFHQVKEYSASDNTKILTKYEDDYWREYDSLPEWYRRFVDEQECCFIVPNLIQIYHYGNGKPDRVVLIYEKAVEYAKREEARQMGIRRSAAW